MADGVKSDNIEPVQFFRGIAALLVLLTHSMDGKYFPADNLIYKICSNGWVGVNIFFIISGFIIPYSMYRKDYKLTDFRIFIGKRIVRIEPPYIISIVLVLLLNFSNTITPWYHGPAYHIDWLNALGHLGYLNAFTRQPWLNGAYWTLAIEFQYYIIIALVYPLFASKNKSVMLLSFIALLGCTFIHLPGVVVNDYHPFQLDLPSPGGQDSASQILPLLPFFLIGIALFLHRVARVSRMEYYAIMGMALLVCFYRHGLVLTGMCFVTVLCLTYMKKVAKPFLLLGTISYSLYLTHGLLVSRFLALFERYTKFTVILGWLLSLLACLIVAYIYYRVVERPFMNISKHMSFGHKPKALAIQEKEKH